jgi:hypothetical protein
MPHNRHPPRRGVSMAHTKRPANPAFDACRLTPASCPLAWQAVLSGILPLARHTAAREHVPTRLHHKSIERAFPLVLWFLAGSTCSLTPGTGARVSETLSRRSPPLPAQTGSLGTTCEGQPPEALCRCMGAPLHHLWKRPGGFLAIGEGQRLCGRGPRGGAAAAGCRLETRRPLGFPWPDPCRDGGATNLREQGHVLDRPPCRTAQQTLGARGREGMSHGSSYGRGAHVGCLSADAQSARWGPSPGGGHLRDEGLDNVVYGQILCQKTFGQALMCYLSGA